MGGGWRNIGCMECMHKNGYVYGEADLGSDPPDDRYRWVCPDCGAEGEDVPTIEEAEAMLQSLTSRKH